MSGRRPGLLSLGVGLAAAGVGAAIGLAAERAAVTRVRPRRGSGAEDLGQVHAPPVPVRTQDGVLLHVEVDQADPELSAAGADDVTIVLSHGYALSLDSWHYQRLALRGRYRLVLWDQRGHGRSASGAVGSSTIDQVGADLGAVIDTVAPTGRLVLLGHSMGGMTVMSLAQQRPELFAERVVGVALVSTSAGGLRDSDLGIAGLGKLVLRLGPLAVRVLARQPVLVERGRKLGSDLESVLVKHYSYASDVSPELVQFTARMIAATRLEVISDFLPSFSGHDKREALEAMQELDVLVAVGDGDLLTPEEYSEEIARRLPAAEHVVIGAGGHLVMLEHPDEVSALLAGLIDRALRRRRAGHAGPTRGIRRTRPVRRSVTPRRGRRDDGAA
ncbi:MAG TPA: alpha/beta hydrolase [Actinomycetes bacterium]|nr:alpha/beta hydrolase [Actinomycetes bacterium]